MLLAVVKIAAISRAKALFHSSQNALAASMRVCSRDQQILLKSFNYAAIHCQLAASNLRVAAASLRVRFAIGGKEA